MFKRRLLIGLLAFGTVAGYASGIASFGWHARACHEHRRQAFEQRVADVCTASAHRVYDERRGEGPPDAPDHHRHGHPRPRWAPTE